MWPPCAALSPSQSSAVLKVLVRARKKKLVSESNLGKTGDSLNIGGEKKFHEHKGHNHY